MFNIHTSILSSLLTLIHPFFVSVIDIKHNAKDKNVELSIRVFTDDIEAVLKKNYHFVADLSKSTNNVEVNKNIALYIQSKLHLYVNEKQQTLKYLGYEIQKESIWIYVEVNNISNVKKINIDCNLLYDYQDKQSNIFNIQANGSDKNYKLDYPKTNATFEW